MSAIDAQSDTQPAASSSDAKPSSQSLKRRRSASPQQKTVGEVANKTSKQDKKAIRISESEGNAIQRLLQKRPLPGGIFAVNKPTGRTSMSLLEDLKPLFASSVLFADDSGADTARRIPKGHRGRAMRKKLQKGGAGGAPGHVLGRLPPKLGQGGTLDPLADGVLVIGVGTGTKRLNDYLAGEKEYYTVGLLGSATVSYDSQDPVVYEKPFEHVTKAALEEKVSESFTGEIDQVPPLFSAVRIDGMRLFDYARQNKPLNKLIPPRRVTVSQCTVEEWYEPSEHAWTKPQKEVSEEDKKIVQRVLKMVEEAEKSAADGGAQKEDGMQATENKQDHEAPVTEKPTTSTASPPAFALRMTVSSGTYVRSVVHDLAKAVGSAAHVVRLTRLQQGPYRIPLVAEEKKAQSSAGDAQEPAAGVASAEKEAQNLEPGSKTTECIPWEVFAKALEELKKEDGDVKGAGHGESKQQPPRQQQQDDDDDDDDAMNNVAPAAPVKESLKSWEKILLAHLTPVDG